MADKKLPGLKREDIQQCMCCGKGVAAGGVVLYRVRVQQFGLDHRAIQRQHGLEMMLGSPALANVMGPNDDLAMALSEEVTKLVCGLCAAEKMGMLLIALGD